MKTYQGKSIRQWSIHFQTTYATFQRRVNGMGFEAAVNLGARPQKPQPSILFEYNGKMQSVKEIAKLTGIKSDTLYARTRRLGIKEAVRMGVPDRRAKQPKKKDLSFINSDANKMGNRLKPNNERMTILRRAISKNQLLCHKTMKPVFAVSDCLVNGCKSGCFDGVYEGNKRVGGVMY